MARVTFYDAITKAVYVDGTLKEPFTVSDVRCAIPGQNYARYYAFLACNSGDNTASARPLFERVARGQYRLRPRPRT